MKQSINGDSHYTLLTPGPLTTSNKVKEVMLKDWCTWDEEYKRIVQSIRSQLLSLGEASETTYTAVLIQGSGTFGVEATIGTVMPKDGKLLVLDNGAYGARMAEIAQVLGITYDVVACAANMPLDADALEAALMEDKAITHVAFVHCETTTGILNPLESLSAVVKKHGKTLIVDAMSSFGGIPIPVEQLGIDYLISSANKCIQGVPGFSFVLCRRAELALCQGRARSLSLDLYDQCRVMDEESGKWRYTSPTHTVRAFAQALVELEQEGGVHVRHDRYIHNQRIVVEQMEAAGFTAYLPASSQSPIITTFYYLDNPNFSFEGLYTFLKQRGFVIYPGKLSDALVFRIGSIGDIHAEDMEELGQAVHDYVKQNIQQ